MNSFKSTDYNTLAQAIEWERQKDFDIAFFAGEYFGIDPERILTLRMLLDDHSEAAFPMLCGPNIGEGGYGKVRELRNLLFNESWAVKFLNNRASDLMVQWSQVTRDSIRNLNISPYLMAYKGCGTMGDHNVQCSLYTPGQSMRQVIQQGSPFVFRDRLKIALALTSGIEELQKRDLIHRDVKPGNIVLSPENDTHTHPTLIDFDFLINFPSYKSQMIEGGHFAGSPKYLPPEIFEFFHQKYAITDEDLAGMVIRLDAYSLGVTLAEFFGATVSIPPIRSEENRVLNFIEHVLIAKEQGGRLDIDFKALNWATDGQKWKLWRRAINHFAPESQLIKLILSLTDWNWKKRATIQQARARLEDILGKY